MIAYCRDCACKYNWMFDNRKFANEFGHTMCDICLSPQENCEELKADVLNVATMLAGVCRKHAAFSLFEFAKQRIKDKRRSYSEASITEAEFVARMKTVHDLGYKPSRYMPQTSDAEMAAHLKSSKLAAYREWVEAIVAFQVAEAAYDAQPQTPR